MKPSGYRQVICFAMTQALILPLHWVAIPSIFVGFIQKI
jgi:hypothetical protein